MYTTNHRCQTPADNAPRLLSRDLLTDQRPPALPIGTVSKAARERRVTGRRLSCAAVVAAVAVSLCALLPAQRAVAMSSQSSGTVASTARLSTGAGQTLASGSGSAFCSPYGGVSQSGVSYDNVYPCAEDNIDDTYGYQCVELSSRFEAAVYGEDTAGQKNLGPATRLSRTSEPTTAFPLPSLAPSSQHPRWARFQPQATSSAWEDLEPNLLVIPVS